MSTTPTRVLSLTCFIFASVACDRRSFDIDWTATQDSLGFKEIVGVEQACGNCITLSDVVTLGTDSLHGFLEDNGSIDYVVRDRSGRYWVGQRTTIKVFDSNGAFVREVGRAGPGPMEFQFAQPLHVDSAGLVHVFDVRNGRETLVSPDFTRQSDRLIPLAINAMAALPGNDHRYVVNRWFATPELLGFPLHIVSDSQVIRSFGIPPNGSITRSEAGRLLAVGPRGLILSMRYNEYILEAWTDSGSRVAGFELSKFSPVEAAGAPSASKVVDLIALDDHRVLVVSRHRRADWEEAVVNRVLPDGTPYLTPRDDRIESIYRSRVDLIDLNSSALMASTWHDGLLLRFVDKRTILEFDHSDNGAPLLHVRSVEVSVR